MSRPRLVLKPASENVKDRDKKWVGEFDTPDLRKDAPGFISDDYIINSIGKQYVYFSERDIEVIKQIQREIPGLFDDFANCTASLIKELEKKPIQTHYEDAWPPILPDALVDQQANAPDDPSYEGGSPAEPSNALVSSRRRASDGFVFDTSQDRALPREFGFDSTMVRTGAPHASARMPAAAQYEAPALPAAAAQYEPPALPAASPAADNVPKRSRVASTPNEDAKDLLTIDLSGLDPTIARWLKGTIQQLGKKPE